MERQGNVERANIRHENRIHHGQLRGGADVLFRDDYRQRRLRRIRHAEKGRDDNRHKDEQRDSGFHRNGNRDIYNRRHKERADDKWLSQCRFRHNLLHGGAELPEGQLRG